MAVTNRVLAQSAEVRAADPLRRHAGLPGASFVGPGGVQEQRGYPASCAARARALDAETAQRLWELSEQLAATTFAPGASHRSRELA